MKFYTIDEVNDHRYYKLPKNLFFNKCYRNVLSSHAKIIYAFLLDRMELSRKNNWTTSDGVIYLMYKKSKLAEETGVSERTIYTSFNQLEDCQLIWQERLGLNKPNKIYIAKIEPSLRMPTDYCIEHCKAGSEESAGQDMKICNASETEFIETEKSNKGTLERTSVRDRTYTFPTFLSLDADVAHAIQYYRRKYQDYRKDEHPNLKREQWERVVDTFTSRALPANSWREIIDRHFVTDYDDCDYNILHFITEGVLKHRMYECGFGYGEVEG